MGDNRHLVSLHFLSSSHKSITAIDKSAPNNYFATLSSINFSITEEVVAGGSKG